MKKIRQNFAKWLGVITMIFLLAIIVSACVKNNNNNATVQTPAALLEVVDASPDAPSMDFYQNGNLINQSPVVYGGGISFFSAYAGKSSATFYQSGTSQKLASDSLNLVTNAIYTLFITNLIATPDFILLKDTIAQPASGMASIRFINLSPNAPAVDFLIKGSAALVTNKAYKGYSSFLAVTAKLNDTLEVVKTGTTTVLASLPVTEIQAGAVYTAGLQGLANGSGTEVLSLSFNEDDIFY
jgi:hypothetical protein